VVVGLVVKAWVRATQSEQGASLVEYALLLALIAMVCFAAVGLLGNSASTRLSGFGGSLGTGS
jgi:pilus assembly protein Flp/PilA